MQGTLSVTGSRAYAGRVLRHMLFGWLTLVAYVWVMVPFAWYALVEEDAEPLVLALLLLAFPVFAAWLFIRMKLEADDAPHASEGLAGTLSHDLVAHLRNRRAFTAGDLFEAAARSKRGAFIVKEMAMEPQLVVSRCRAELDASVDASSLVQDAWAEAQKRGEARVTAPLLILAAISRLQEGKAILREADLSPDDLAALLLWESFRHELSHADPFWAPSELARNGSVGRSWVMGYTDQLDRMTTDIADTVSLRGERKVVVHKDRIASMLHVTARSTQRNMLVLGKVGVGKRTLVENFAATLRASERAKNLPFTRVLQLQTQDLISGQATPDAFLLSALNRAASSGHFILVIRDIAMFLSSGSDTLRGVLMKFLEAKNIAIIGIADTQDYHAHIKTNPLLDSMFEKIDVPDTDDAETLSVLMAHTMLAEKKGINVTYKALRATIDLSKRYLAAKGFPGVTKEVLDDAVLKASELGDKTVLEDHVRDVVSLRGKINVQKISTGEKERLLGLEQVLCRKVIGQEPAVRAVAAALKRARMDLSDRKRPIGTFLFLGPTGVGKTQTAKTLAEEYFGSAEAMVRLDMNEFSHADSVFNISGASSGGGAKEGFLAQRVQDKPFSLILLDEIEKAHPAVLNLFLQILDEGFMTDARGIRTDFRNTIIIATSNAGALFIRDFVKAHPDASQADFKASLIESILQQKLFSPEFINRFDEVILFYPLRHEHARTVAILMIDDVIRDLQRKRGIAVQIDPDVLNALVERGYSVEFGAREMRRTITEMIEDHIADYLLRHNVQRGDVIEIHAKDIKW